jgi:hypothetical protein
LDYVPRDRSFYGSDVDALAQRAREYGAERRESVPASSSLPYEPAPLLSSGSIETVPLPGALTSTRSSSLVGSDVSSQDGSAAQLTSSSSSPDIPGASMGRSTLPEVESNRFPTASSNDDSADAQMDEFKYRPPAITEDKLERVEQEVLQPGFVQGSLQTPGVSSAPAQLSDDRAIVAFTARRGLFAKKVKDAQRLKRTPYTTPSNVRSVKPEGKSWQAVVSDLGKQADSPSKNSWGGRYADGPSDRKRPASFFKYSGRSTPKSGEKTKHGEKTYHYSTDERRDWSSYAKAYKRRSAAGGSR